MSAYTAEFIGGNADPLTKTITTHDSLHGNKQMTLSFYSGCPGTGFDVRLATVVQLSAACYATLETAVQNQYKVRLEGTQNGFSLSAIVHSILP
jgi:hypothetical protein